MTTYRFETTTTMKPYNCKKWWIDADIVRPVEIEADDLKTALQQYREKVGERDYIEISKTALKHPDPMYIDGKDGEPRQVGYVITGKTYFEDRSANVSSTQYIDLWVSVKQVANVEFAA